MAISGVAEHPRVITRVSAENLSVARGGRVLFTGLGFTVEAGEAVALIGANGSGKTSLLRAIAGMIRPEAGEVAFTAPGGPLEAEEARSRGLHLMGHQDGLKPTRTAGEELDFHARWTGGTDAAIAAAVEQLELKALLALETRKLSAGQRRRLTLGRLIASPRSLWLLDEPLAPLDARWRERTGALMAEHLASGGLIIAAVHDPLPVPSRELSL